MEQDDETITSRITELLENEINPRTGKRYTDLEISIATHGEIKGSHLSAIRHGRIQNLTRKKILALCILFRKDPRYFFPELDDLTDLTL